MVDNRFCFEGGASCGKGEGLYVFVTDLGDEITHTIKLASKGNLSSKKRPFAKKLAGLDSPKKQKQRGISEIEEVCTIHTNESIHDCGCVPRMSYWPSQESRDLDSNYGCGDTASVSEAHDSLHDMESGFSRGHINNMERCMSCISKLGAMSRSSTITVGTPAGNGPPSVWTTVSEHYQMQASSNTLSGKIVGPDRMSLCSHGSSNNSDSYPMLRQIGYPSADSWYEPAPVVQQLCNRLLSPTQARAPPDRPPKPGDTCKSPQSHVGPYENYDFPKMSVNVDRTSTPITTENYDTPKKLQEYLSKDMNSNSNVIDKYGNYDMPVSIGKSVCGCLGADVTDTPTGPRTDCACTRIMSWTDSWICKRGNGIENTTVPVNKVKLTGEGKMPVMDASKEHSAIYAVVDPSKKNKKRTEVCKCDRNTENVAPKVEEVPADTANGGGNYANLEFEKSLENYENSKEVLQRAGLFLDVDAGVKTCHKCGHSTKTPDTPVNEPQKSSHAQENYMMMEPGSKKPNCPGYVPMHPPPQQQNQDKVDDTEVAPPLPTKSDLLKQRMNRIIGEKSASNPSLIGPAVDRSLKRSNNETRVPGSAMMVIASNGNSPYTRKQLMDCSDLLPIEKRLTVRKRSSSADSSRFLDGEDCMSPLSVSGSPSTETLRKSSLTNINTGRRSSSPCVHRETEVCKEAHCCSTPTNATAPDSDEISGSTTASTSQTNSVYIRRSESVPCKAQNRDSSSSNDSGVSTGSLRQRGTDFTEFELPLTTSMSSRRHIKHLGPKSCVHASLPRRSKSFDPLRDLSFHFQRIKVPEKSTSAEAEVPICTTKEPPANPTQPYVDSRSTSSGTSDMSDYIETLSLSSHSSSDAQDGLK